jgi:hypothetical protein
MMSEFEQILAELAQLKCAFNELRSNFTISQTTYFENLPPDAVVGVDYVSYKFGCSQNAVVRGRFGTDKIPRFREKPIAYIKRNVDSVFGEFNKSVSEIAAEYRHKSKTGKRSKKTKL